MNIFATDPDPFVSAQALDDKRVIKMILETAQILSTAVFIRNHVVWLSFRQGTFYGEYSDTVSKPLYFPTHKNHPVSVWARETRENYSWLLLHGKALHRIYAKAYDREHASFEVLMHLTMESCMDSIPMGPLTPFANAARRKDLNIDFTHIEDVHEAYQRYLMARWALDARPPTWKKRELPPWSMG